MGWKLCDSCTNLQLPHSKAVLGREKLIVQHRDLLELTNLMISWWWIAKWISLVYHATFKTWLSVLVLLVNWAELLTGSLNHFCCIFSFSFFFFFFFLHWWPFILLWEVFACTCLSSPCVTCSSPLGSILSSSIVDNLYLVCETSYS